MAIITSGLCFRTFQQTRSARTPQIFTYVDTEAAVAMILLFFKTTSKENIHANDPCDHSFPPIPVMHSS